MKHYITIIVFLAALYQSVSWGVFQWRNPMANKMSFFRNFIDVSAWRKLPEYQPSAE